MKTKILTKIAIASMLCAPSCAVESGIVVESQNLPEEKALYVKLIDKDGNEKQEQPQNGMFCADRKLFFRDSSYVEPFVYAIPGDTISFYNPFHSTYIKMNKINRVHDINGVGNREVVKQMRPYIIQYRKWLKDLRNKEK